MQYQFKLWRFWRFSRVSLSYVWPMPMWVTPNKIPGHQGLEKFHICFYTLLLEELSAVYMTLLRGKLEVCAWLLLDYIAYAFIFANFHLYLYTVINHCHEYQFFWVMWVLLVNHQNWELAWGPPTFQATTTSPLDSYVTTIELLLTID